MSLSPKQVPTPITLPFEKFWSWLQAHANCILRAGTPDTVLFDHEDFHWHLAAEDDATLVVQLVRGKELVSEMILLANEVAYVQCEMSEGDEYICECIMEGETSREVAYHFVMAHEYDEAEQSVVGGHWTH
ncbi:hypothetical protein [Haliangium ochraceum]|nr:hypothetical protein [Haliangium ochraceum]